MVASVCSKIQSLGVTANSSSSRGYCCHWKQETWSSAMANRLLRSSSDWMCGSYGFIDDRQPRQIHHPDFHHLADGHPNHDELFCVDRLRDRLPRGYWYCSWLGRDCKTLVWRRCNSHLLEREYLPACLTSSLLTRICR